MILSTRSYTPDRSPDSSFIVAARDMFDILQRATSCVICNVGNKDISTEERKGFLQISYFSIIFLMQLMPSIAQAEILPPPVQDLHSMLIRTTISSIDEYLFHIISYELAFDEDPFEQSTLLRSIIPS